MFCELTSDACTGFVVGLFLSFWLIHCLIAVMGISPCCVACENIQLWCHALFKVLQWGASPVCCWFFVLGEVSHAFQLECEYTEVVFFCVMSLSILTPFR